MTIQYINVGTNPNDGTGEDLRSAFLKVNLNFQELAATANTNATTGSNIGSGEGLYASKTGTTLQFKSLVQGTGITLTPGSNTLTISSTVAEPNTISRIVSQNGLYNITLPNQTLNIVGAGATQTSISGSTLSINTVFNIEDDTSPSLGADLDLNSFDITGTGNVNITGDITVDNLTIGRPGVGVPYPGALTLNGNLAVGGTTQLAGVTASGITVSTGTVSAANIVGTSSVTGLFFGNITGDVTGNVKSKFGAHAIVLNVEGETATLNANVFGSLSGAFTGTVAAPGIDLNGQTISGQGTIELDADFLLNDNPLIVNANHYQASLDPSLFPPRVIDGANCAVFTVPVQTDYGFAESIRLRSTQINGTQVMNVGTGILFESTNDVLDPLTVNPAPEYVAHGKISMQTYSDDTYSDFVVQVRSALGLSTTYDGLIVAGDGKVHASGLTFNFGEISNRQLNPVAGVNQPFDIDVNVTTISSTGKLVGLYLGGPAGEGYKFPRTRGVFGQVLTAPLSGDTLEWTAGGGGGGGSGVSYFASLLDTPGGYPVGSAGKLVRVRSDELGLEYANNVTANVTGDLTGRANTASRLHTARTISGVSFDGSANIDLTTDNIQESLTPTNKYFTQTRVRDSLSVTAGQALTYDALTGLFDLSESTIATPDTLVRRDIFGNAVVETLRANSLEATGVSLNVDSNLTGAFDLTTTGVVSATNFVTTGTGDPTIDSTGKIVLNPTTYVDVSTKQIKNVATPTDTADATTKSYVDTAVSGVSTAAITQIPVTADLGGVKNIQKNNTLNFIGGTNINTVSGTNSITINLDTTLQNISVSGDLSVTAAGVGTGNITSTSGYVKGGNVKIDGNAVTQTVVSNDLHLVPGTGGAVAVDAALNVVDGTLAISGFETITISAASTPEVIGLATNATFIRTLDWSSPEAGLAYATIDSGRDGQIKTIIIETRGVYGEALDTQPRHVVLSGNIEGANRSITIGANPLIPNASATFMFLNNYWWRIAKVD